MHVPLVTGTVFFYCIPDLISGYRNRYCANPALECSESPSLDLASKVAMLKLQSPLRPKREVYLASVARYKIRATSYHCVLVNDCVVCASLLYVKLDARLPNRCGQRRRTCEIPSIKKVGLD